MFPHSTLSSTGEVCLVTPDLKKGKKPDHEATIEQWKDLLEKAGVTSVCNELMSIRHWFK